MRGLWDGKGRREEEKDWRRRGGEKEGKRRGGLGKEYWEKEDEKDWKNSGEEDGNRIVQYK